MRIDGEWYECDDGIIRPVIRGEVLGHGGAWIAAEFLLDTGADRTVLSAALLAALRLQATENPDRLGGLGGIADSVSVETQIRLTRDGARKVVFRGQFAAVTELEALDLSVMGRDLTDLLVVIVDRPRDVVCLVSPGNRYVIRPEPAP